MPEATRILVADDERPVRTLAKTILESAGYHVTEVDDGAPALAALLAEGSDFAALMSDCRMTKVNGPELLAQLRAAGSDVPVVLTSGSESATSIPGFAKDRRAAFLAKPYRADVLRDLLKSLLASA